MTNRRRQSRAGMTLIELLIAVTLFGAISASMGVVLNIAFTSMNKIDAKVDFNRRVIASQRTLDQILQGLIPMVVPCGGRPIGIAANPASATFLSSHSLGGGSRGRPSIIRLFAAPSPNGGQRLLLNEYPYLGRFSLTQACAQPPIVEPASFILADRLSILAFSYRRRDPGSGAEIWVPFWSFPEWPSGVRIDMAPLLRQQNQIQPTVVFAPLMVMNNNADDTIR